MLTVGRHALGQHPPQRHHARLGATGGQHPGRIGAEGNEPDAPGSAHAQTAEHERDAFGDVRLQAQRGAERHRRRDIEHDPRRERALGHVHPHVRLAGTGGGGGVDVTHVVTDLVRAQLGELCSGADPGGSPVARKHPRDHPADGDVERLDQRLRHRPRALAGRGRL